MNFPVKGREIESLLKTLDEAKQRSSLLPDDPSVIALEEIMLAKVTALHAAKLQVQSDSDVVPLESAKQPNNEQPTTSELPPLLFAPLEEGPNAPASDVKERNATASDVGSAPAK